MDNNHSSTNEYERLDAAWAKIEREFEARASPPQSPPKDVSGESSCRRMNGGTMDEISSEYTSPLMAHPSDATLQTSNRTSLLLSHDETAESSTSIVANNHQKATELIPNKQSLLQKYRRFLQKYEPSLGIVEHIMERFVFYGFLFKHDHRGTSTEMYYAAWNVIRWMNDVVLVGWGEGMGTTVGRREEWLPLLGRNMEASSESIILRLNAAVPIIRAILTATTCIYPAMEAWSRRSIHSRPSYGTPLLRYDDDSQQNQEEYQMFATTTDLSPQKRRHEWEARQCRTAGVSYRLERVRFLVRLALVSISWWAQYRRRCSREEDDDAKKLFRANEGGRSSLPSLLRRGGELDPYEQLVPLKDAEEEAKVVQYVGRRTGRCSIASTSTAQPSSRSQSCGSPPCIPKISAFVKWLSKLGSSNNKILCVYAVGEVLHILRPLYWSHAEKKDWQRRSSSKKISQNSSYSFAIWRAWWISLLMDWVSDKLLQIPYCGDSTLSIDAQAQCRGSFLARTGGRSTHQLSSTSSPSAEQAKLEELEWRRSRYGLYLLRSPMYNAFTRPLATLLGKIVSVIPSFGLGRWASEYMLDMMGYWNDNHFMLES